MYLYTIYHINLSSTTGNEVKLCLERHISSQNSCMGRNLFISLQCVFHSIRFKVNKGGVQRYSFFYTFPHRLPSPSIKNHPVRMKNHPVRMTNQPARMNLDENPANPGWNDQFAPDEMTSPSRALAQRQTYPISPPSCTKDRHVPPFYSSQEENAGARKIKDKYIGDRWREIPPTLKASAENADRPLLAKLPI